MDVKAVKLDLVQKLLNVRSESVLRKIGQILEKEEIIAYSSEGNPLTKKQYNSRLENGENEISAGNFMVQEDVEKESDDW